MIPVPGYDGRYWATQYGEIVGTSGEKLADRTSKEDYLVVALYDVSGKRRDVAVHRVVAEAYLPNPLGHNSIDHLDGNKRNNAPWNLRWMDIKDNIHRQSVSGLPMGVRRDKGGRYSAAKRINGVRHWSPTFGTPEEAGQWYTQKVR